MRGVAGLCQLSQPVHERLYRHRLWTSSNVVGLCTAQRFVRDAFLLSQLHYYHHRSNMGIIVRMLRFCFFYEQVLQPCRDFAR